MTVNAVNGLDRGLRALVVPASALSEGRFIWSTLTPYPFYRLVPKKPSAVLCAGDLNPASQFANDEGRQYVPIESLLSLNKSQRLAAPR